MKNFVLLGMGFVAPRHVQAIKDVGGNLLAFLNPSTSVGWIDKYYPEAKFFQEFEIFDRYCERMQREGPGIDYVVICSPNYLHEPQCRWAMRMGADVICEKPLALTVRNAEPLLKVEEETGKCVNVLHQLRCNPQLQEARTKVQEKIYVGSDYIVEIVTKTYRGPWIKRTWKWDENKSGGLATNIGCHLFDLMFWFFGPHRKVYVYQSEPDYVSGEVTFFKAKVHFYLSTRDKEPQRTITMNDDTLDYSGGFTDLHTVAYREIMEGNGVKIKDVLPSIGICEEIRKQGRSL